MDNKASGYSIIGKESTKEDSFSFRNRLYRYGPLLLWLVLIFFASTGTLSGSNTSRIIRPILLWLWPTLSDAFLMEVHFKIRKLAHFVSYAILAILAARAFITSSLPLLRDRWHLISFLLVAVYSLLDELHQSFVPSRTSSIYDSFIDMAGGATALFILFLWYRYRLNRRT
jgi:VanZ family protein